MRLRQAHAIIEAATALEAAGLGFQMCPFDYDAPGTVRSISDDFMDGEAECSDPDDPDGDVRGYVIQLKPGPDDVHITVLLSFGYDLDQPALLLESFDVSQPHRDDDGSRFRGLVGARIVERVVAAVNENERPYRDAYILRTTEK